MPMGLSVRSFRDGGVVLRRPSRFRCARGPWLVALTLGTALGLATQASASDPVLIGMNDVDQPGGPDELVRLNRTTGEASRLHVFTASGFNLLESLAYDPRENLLWSTNGGVLVRVQPVTYASTQVGNTGLDDVDGLAVHPVSGVLYGVTYGGNDLVRIDKLDAGAVVINSDVEPGYRLEDLAFDPAGRLFILTSRALVEVDPQTGARVARVFLQGATSLEGLVWDPLRGTFLSAADRDGCKDLVTVDRSTGQVAFLDPLLHSGFKDIEALALVPGSPVVPVALQRVEALRDESGSVLLQWESGSDQLQCRIERAFGPAGPWAEILRAGAPISGHAGAWRYAARDDEAAALPELRVQRLYYRVQATDAGGEQGMLQFEVAAAAPRRAVLYPNAPNPFNPTTVFAFDLAVASAAEVTIYDVRGTALCRLQTQAGPGRHSLVWDGRDAAGHPVAAGVYPYLLRAGGQQLRGSAILVK
jgi:hypothetical protein